MFRVRRERNHDVVLTVSGRIESADLSELRQLINRETESALVILDLTDVTLIDRTSVRFLASLEQRGVRIVNCPLYISNWMTKERWAPL